MSDFINNGWSWYVIAIVVGGLAFCLFVLMVASKTKPRPTQKNATSSSLYGNMTIPIAPAMNDIPAAMARRRRKAMTFGVAARRSRGE